MTINWKAVEQYFTVVLFVFRFYSVCNFGKSISFGLVTVRSERIKHSTGLYLDALLQVCHFGLHCRPMSPYRWFKLSPTLFSLSVCNFGKCTSFGLLAV